VAGEAEVDEPLAVQGSRHPGPIRAT
jgi:hypothetical protein